MKYTDCTWTVMIIPMKTHTITDPNIYNSFSEVFPAGRIRGYSLITDEYTHTHKRSVTFMFTCNSTNEAMKKVQQSNLF